MERTYKTLVVAPGFEFRQEGPIEHSFFGENSESPISALAKELHIHTQGETTTIFLENPVSGGPFVVAQDGTETVLTPGEKTFLRNKSFTLFLKKIDHVQILIFS